MLNKKMMEMVNQFSQKPTLFEEGTGNIWTEPYLASQMLLAHIEPNVDAASRRMELIDKTVKFLNEQIKEGGAILDLGCGPGLYAEKLCRSGHKVTGVDFSRNSILYAQNSARKQGLDIEYVCKNVLSLTYKKCYDAAIQIYGELNTFSDEKRDQLFRIVHQALKPEGLFIFEVSTPYHMKENKCTRNWSISEKGFWRETRHLVLEEGFEYDHDIWLNQYIIIDEKEVKVYRNWFHEYTKEAIEDIVLRAGFSQVQVVEDLLEEGAKEKMWLTIVAQK